jgi:phosphoribosylamine--glycine ligase
MLLCCYWFWSYQSISNWKNIEMVVVGPRPIGQRNLIFLEWHELNHIPVIGPSKLGAQLEGSKEFAKSFS